MDATSREISEMDGLRKLGAYFAQMQGAQCENGNKYGYTTLYKDLFLYEQPRTRVYCLDHWSTQDIALQDLPALFQIACVLSYAGPYKVLEWVMVDLEATTLSGYDLPRKHLRHVRNIILT